MSIHNFSDDDYKNNPNDTQTIKHCIVCKSETPSDSFTFMNGDTYCDSCFEEHIYICRKCDTINKIGVPCDCCVKESDNQ